MSKKKLSPRRLQTVLIGDELLDANLANLVPASSKIGDSAATFIDKAYKLLGGDATLSIDQVQALHTAVDLAQETVRLGAAVNRLLRQPYTSGELIDEAEQMGDAATHLTKVTASDINVTPVRVIQ